jgi:hypothetical protein
MAFCRVSGDLPWAFRRGTRQRLNLPTVDNKTHGKIAKNPPQIRAIGKIAKKLTANPHLREYGGHMSPSWVLDDEKTARAICRDLAHSTSYILADRKKIWAAVHLEDLLWAVYVWLTANPLDGLRPKVAYCGTRTAQTFFFCQLANWFFHFNFFLILIFLFISLLSFLIFPNIVSNFFF